MVTTLSTAGGAVGSLGSGVLVRFPFTNLNSLPIVQVWKKTMPIHCKCYPRCWSSTDAGRKHWCHISR